eukprot:gene7476-biopygen6026
MRWKAFFYEKSSKEDPPNDDRNNTFGFKSRKCPPQNEDLTPFENDLLNMVKHIQFRNIHDNFQDQLRKDIQKINRSTKAFIPADKTTNFYELDKNQHDKLLMNSITTTYKKANDNSIHNINNEALNIATELNLQDRTERMAERNAFITLKDHKDNFDNNPTCRLINPAKSEIGRISKQILEKINTTIRTATALNQWKNTLSVINWFKKVENKQQHTFIIFDIESFYPSISKKLLSDAISFAKTYCNITEQEINIIMHARKSLLFNKGTTWVKKDSNMFDVTMGSFDGAEICELVGLFILNQLCTKYGRDNIGLYRDDGLAIFKNITGPQADRIRKDITKHFKQHGLNITIQTNLKIVNYLDVTLNLINDSYYPYRKPNNKPLYINTKSNHPPNIIKQLPAAINRRISDISCNETEFNKAKPIYEDALQSSGYDEPLSFTNNGSPSRVKRNRQRNIIWFNPPYSKNVQTNIGKTFLKLINKHFHKNHKFHKIFNKNNVKVSYSCTDNMESIISKHNKKVTNTANTANNSTDKTCNCYKKDQCPLNNNCLTSSIIYNAKVTTNEDTTEKNYIGLTEGTFKKRYTQHKQSFRNRRYANSTELSKYIWDLKDKNKDYDIQWTIITSANAYSNITKRCDLCLTEKLYIVNANNDSLLNKRSELISKCRHENKFYLKNNRTPNI